MKKEFYREHRIPKKDGSLRVLEIPSDELKAVQRDYYEHEVLNGVGPGPYSFGCVRGRSPKDMARMHAGRSRGHVVVFDLKDAFHNVRPKHLHQALKWEKFTDKEIDDRLQIPDWVETGDFSRYRYPYGMFSICFVEPDRRNRSFKFSNPYAAMGAPTSPYLLNLALKKMDFASAKVLKRVEGARYSRYVDDIVISSNSSEIIPLAKKVLMPMFADHGFPINMRKFKVQRNKSNRQMVLGVQVNDATTLPKNKRHSARGAIHRLFRMALDGVDQDGNQVDFEEGGEFFTRLSQVQGYLDGWTREVAPEFYKKIQQKWESTKLIAKTRERRST